MDKNRTGIERFMPKSTFGVTLITIAIIIIVLGFFFRGVGRLNQRDASSEPTADKRDSSFDDLLPPGPLQLPEDLASDNPNAGKRIKLWEPYGEDRSTPDSIVEPGYIASLVRTSDCRWTDDNNAPLEGAQFRVGQTLDVAAGLVEIAFACGAKAIIEGPAVLELKSEKGGALLAGRITADVPDEIEGFTLTTPVAQLVSISKEQRESVAKLTATVDCLWGEGSESLKKGMYLKPGQRVKLASGLAEITFYKCDAKVILQGPAELELETEMTAILHSGKVTADVPDELEGFKIRTPVAEVISLAVDAKSTDAQSETVSAEQSEPKSETVAPGAEDKPEGETPAKEPEPTGEQPI